MFGSGQTKIGARGVDTRHSHSQIVIVEKRSAYELLQFLIFENVKPLQITNRCLICSTASAKGIRDRRSCRFALTSDTSAQQTKDNDSRKSMPKRILTQRRNGAKRCRVSKVFSSRRRAAA